MNLKPLLPIRRPLAALLAFALAGATGGVAAQALTPAFTYQGELRLASGPATAPFDMQFRLFSAATDGAQIGATVTATNVPVTGGLFSVPLDFGVAQFAGERQWLEIRIRPAGSGSYETLSPRTEVTAAPYAWSAAVALANSVTTTSIVDGTIGSADINPAQVQRRVNDACQVFEAVRAINEDGTLMCNEIGTGSVTLVQTGNGLTGGPIVNNGTISVANGGIGTVQLADGGVKGVDVDPAQVQLRVLGTCDPGQYMRVVNADGTVACGTDETGLAGWTLSGNAGTNPTSNFIGTTDAQAVNVRASNQRVARLEAIPLTGPAGGHTANVLLGSRHNTITPGVRGATIAGGGAQAGDSDPELSLEAPNQVTDHYGTVGGGYGNQAGDAAGTTVDRAFATVGGGALNTAGGALATVGGGQNNTASGPLSTVGGGLNNTASISQSTVGGGAINTASGIQSTVGGGGDNTAGGSQSTVGGGSDNAALGLASTVGGGFGNSASSRDSVVGGGAENTASGIQSTVGGGLLNTASGIQSTVGGGVENCAGGELSWAGGSNAKVRPGSSSGADGRGCLGVPRAGLAAGDEGTFVWADSQNADFVSTGVNQFLIRANGGFGFNTNSVPTGIEAVFQGRTGPNANVDLYLKPAAHGRGINLAMLPGAGAAAFYISQYDGSSFVDRILLQSNGDLQVTAQAFKPGGGSWAVPSDARLKSEVAPLAGTLDRLMALRPVEFTYRPEVTPKSLYLPGRQVGFIAQEVEQVFPEWVSVSDEGWKTVGPRGFEALTVEALRELRAESATIDGAQSQRIAALEAENAALRAESAQLRARLERLEGLVVGRIGEER